MDAIKATVWNDANLQENFDRAVGLFKSFLLQRSMNGTHINISQVSTEHHTSGESINPKKKKGKENKKGKRKRDQDDDDSDVEDRYYKAREYAKLNSKQKEKLRKLRDERERKVVAALEAIPTIQTQIAAISTNNQEDDEETEDEETPRAFTSNRDNPALKRPKKG